MSIFFRRPTTEQRAIGLGSAGFAIGAANVTSMRGGLALAPVYASVTLITDALSTAPLNAYRKVVNGQSGAILNTQPDLVADPGVGRVTLSTWLTQCTASLLLRGNAYGIVAGVTPGGIVSKIKWLNPDTMSVDESGDAPVYKTGGVVIPPGQIVHIPAFTLPGTVVGLSPMTLFRLAIEMGLNAQQFGHDLLQNGVAPSGKLVNKTTTITPSEADSIKKRFREAVQSRDIFVTGNDWDYSALSMSGADSQFIETMKITATQIASIYHVQPEDIGGSTGGSMTYATLESNERKFNKRTLLPWAKRIEDCLDALLPGPQYVKFDLDASVRGDLMTRMAAYKLALESGVYTLTDVRAKENLPELTAAQIDEWQANYKSQKNGVPALPEPESKIDDPALAAPSKGKTA